MTNQLFIDDWAGNVISDYAPMKAGGVAGSINRLGQGDAYNNTGESGGHGDYLYKGHHDGAAANDLLNQTYWVIDPAIYWKQQLDWVVENWPGPDYDDLPFSVDVELTGGKSKPEIVDCVGNFLGAFESHYKQRPIIYTGKYWFWEVQMLDASGLMPLWQTEYDFWLAQYPLKSQPRITTTWEGLKNYYPTGWTAGIAPPRVGMIMRPVALWQWSGDKFVLPGISGPIDLNFVPQEWIDKNRRKPAVEPPIEASLTDHDKIEKLWSIAKTLGWPL